MYQIALEAAKKYLIFKPMLPEPKDILLAGSVGIVGTDEVIFDPLVQHLTCFVGGMIALAAKVFDRPGDLEMARQIADGCVWAYGEMPTGIMPELFRVVPCASASSCLWDDDVWYAGVEKRHMIGGWEDAVVKGKLFAERHGLNPGWTQIQDSRYLLRYDMRSILSHIYIQY